MCYDFNRIDLFVDFILSISFAILQFLFIKYNFQSNRKLKIKQIGNIPYSSAITPIRSRPTVMKHIDNM